MSQDADDSKPLAGWQFQHHAMATTFQIVIISDDPEEASFAADAAFREVDQMELELSRFKPGSDISRLNDAARDEEVYVSPAACDCLLLAHDVSRATGGAFDITIGPLYRLWREAGSDGVSDDAFETARASCGWEQLKTSAFGPTAVKTADGMQIDLGGIGKGYALDQAAELLRDWDIKNALLSAGGSTVLAIGSSPDSDSGWPVQVGPPDIDPTFLADGNAISGSGFEVQGEHIIDPRTGRPCPMTGTDRPTIWAQAPNAALSDALSTAFMILSREAIDKLCSEQDGIVARFFTPGK
ncbi:MAG: thiamine biosynthesis lipoprotein [Verrucomicrobiales bacterium]|jgi:thiamine biosynthesis lipoprotein